MGVASTWLCLVNIAQILTPCAPGSSVLWGWEGGHRPQLPRPLALASPPAHSTVRGLTH